MIFPATTYKEIVMKESEYCTDDCNEAAVKGSSKSTKTSEKKGKDTQDHRDTSSQAE
jgi:hypothetical protein